MHARTAQGPHDLRRTFAKLAHQGQAPLEQIQLTLGHASIVTTERYLGVRPHGVPQAASRDSADSWKPSGLARGHRAPGSGNFG